MEYLDMLRSTSLATQTRIEEILKNYYVQPVGTGYIDLITMNEYIESLITDLTKVNIIIHAVSWWCHCTKESETKLGCPHGMGGPYSDYFDGWFSETQIPLFDIDEQELKKINKLNLVKEVKAYNDRINTYIKKHFSKSKDYSECMVPALWLFVPEEWNRIIYQIT
ncbi:hypothetical protein [Paenibacillus sp. URB8-2]|uniref:hypothetical protein n=1 Tax=Paenibacillus sp. URB8-2 TaxID=2741301 RepID=UPI0015B90B62|nr:hypothetical protein [Paenibacillus sp. URB8-2]BCG59453.1 hypothetical protein PUR_28780 [Paenibacillus sp. URB8-2]